MKFNICGSLKPLDAVQVSSLHAQIGFVSGIYFGTVTETKEHQSVTSKPTKIKLLVRNKYTNLISPLVLS